MELDMEYSAGNSDLHAANKAKKDCFYTYYDDIEKELNTYYEYNNDIFKDKVILLPCDDPEWSEFTKFFVAKFDEWGLKKLISTSYVDSAENFPLTPIEEDSPYYDEDKHYNNGKLFIKERGNGKTDVEFKGYLDGNGDFRSEEVTKYRNEADIIVTNPPFSLFREFIKWIFDAKKQFIIIGNQNCITYKEVFPLIKDNLLWLGETIHSGDRAFYVPDSYPLTASGCGTDKDGRKFVRVKGVRWFTNIEIGSRHEKLGLMTYADNLKYNKKLVSTLQKEYGTAEYPKYDNYDAIEVPITKAIPSDYEGCMGVPITFLDKYCPEQFEIIKFRKGDDDRDLAVNGKYPYFRIIIKRRVL